jgi:hypothetical protein
MRNPRNKTGVIALAVLLSLFAISSGKTKTPSPFSVLQNKECGFSLRYPKEAKLEIQESCTLKITLPPIKGQEWIKEANITLEVSAAENGEATEKPVDMEEVTGTLLAGGLKFEKSVVSDSGAGHHHIMVSYTAIGKHHQYHWLGIMTAVDPGTLGKPLKNWDPERSAQKLFDGFISGFRPLE